MLTRENTGPGVIFHFTPLPDDQEMEACTICYQIAEDGKKPVDVYLEVGFEDLSYFSFGFMKHFGYMPTKISRK
jgi:AraC-like DNA-binding protein